MTTQTPDAVREAVARIVYDLAPDCDAANKHRTLPFDSASAASRERASKAADAILAALDSRAGDAGEGMSGILSRFPNGWKVRQVQFSAPCADDRKWHVNVYGGKEGRDAFVGRGATAELALLDAAAQANPMPATPAPAVDAVELAAFGASEHACALYPGADQAAERAAFIAGAAHEAKPAVDAVPAGEVE